MLMWKLKWQVKTLLFGKVFLFVSNMCDNTKFVKALPESSKKGHEYV